MLRVVNEEHPEKTDDPIEVQLVALKLTSVRPLQSENAQSPIVVTELGMVTLVRPLQYQKA